MEDREANQFDHLGSLRPSTAKTDRTINGFSTHRCGPISTSKGLLYGSKPRSSPHVVTSAVSKIFAVGSGQRLKCRDREQ